ncbi:hypothetical protein LCGC14_0898200 [marine sediment metagenome]|uniref:Uncharacterized protein n=1 Tax=marine sediment metagenome TaxID=412755 RepID=A0A0F9NX51_9ZZZZ
MADGKYHCPECDSTEVYEETFDHLNSSDIQFSGDVICWPCGWTGLPEYIVYKEVVVLPHPESKQ